MACPCPKSFFDLPDSPEYVEPNSPNLRCSQTYPNLTTDLILKFRINVWEQRKLNDVVSQAKSYAFTRAIETTELTGFKYIHYGDIHTRVADKISDPSVLPNIKKGDYRYLSDNDVIIADASEDYKGIADSAILLHHKKYRIIAGLHTIAITPVGIQPLFLYYLLRTEQFKHYGYKVGTGLKVFGISFTNFSNFTFQEPNSTEQKNIYSILDSFDKLIAANQDKLDQLKDVKKLLMQKIFDQEWRFAGFTDPWEQRKLGDVGSVSMNKRIFKDQTSTNGDIPFYKIGTFGKKADSYIPIKLFNEYKKKYSYPEIGDTLISASGSIGRTVEYKGEKAYFQDSNIVWLNHSDELENSFLKQFYEIVKWYGLEGSTIKRLYNKNILETPICLPVVQEQRKIGFFLAILDDLIAANQCQQKLIKNGAFINSINRVKFTNST